jgi:hypothetical protein
MILLTQTPDELECGACPHCSTKVFISCTPILDSIPKLRMLLNGTLNTCACNVCGESVTAEDPVWINMEHHGLEPMFYMPLSYLESGYIDPAALSDPVNTNQIYYSLNELASQVRARILIRRLPIGV